MLDVVTPGFLTLRNKGILVNNQMLREKLSHTVDYTVCNAIGTDRGVPVTYDAITDRGLEVVPVKGLLENGTMWQKFEEFDRFTDLAITRAHANVNLSEMNLYASMGELPETVRWIHSIVKRVGALTKALRGKLEVARVLNTLKLNAEDLKRFKDFNILKRYTATLARRKLNRRPSASPTDTLVGLWLEYRYAVRPLIADLQNAIKALDKAISTERLTARGREYHVGGSEQVISVPPTPNSNSIGVTAKITSKETIKARAGCLYIVDAQLSSFLDVLGLDQPVEALYELIPFSFILDWVFSIGDLLESWFKSSGLNVLQSWVTLQVETTRTCKVLSAKLYPESSVYKWPNQNFELGSSTSSVQWKWRQPNPQLPMIPRFDLKLDLAKIIDLGAILRSSIGGSTPVVAKRG